MIYFNSDKIAFGFEIPDAIATVDDDTWGKYCASPAGTDWDIVDGKFTAISTEDFVKAKEAAKGRICDIKALLINSDYKVLKYTEGELTEEEWATAKAERQAWRDEINTLQIKYSLS